MPAYRVTTPPLQEPVALEDAKLWFKQDVSDDDNLINGLITAARDYCETFTSRAFVTQQWTMTLDAFPGYSDRTSTFSAATLKSTAWFLYGTRWGFVLPASPVVSVDSVAYNDQNGNPQTLTAGVNYTTDVVSSPARIFPSFGTFWPITQYAPNGVTVKFTCGYGSPEAVPQAIKTAIMMQASWIYNNRDAYFNTTGTVRDNPAVTALLGMYRVLSY